MQCVSCPSGGAVTTSSDVSVLKKGAVISRLRHFISANAFAGLCVLITKIPVNNLNHGQEKEEADEALVLVSFLKSDPSVFLFQRFVFDRDYLTSC